jgi:hypothetical protein
MRQQEEDDIRKLLFGGRGHMLRDLFMASPEASVVVVEDELRLQRQR